MQIDIRDFPDYLTYPSQGLKSHTDRNEFDIFFEVIPKGTRYYAKIDLYIEYNRYYRSADHFEPAEDVFDITEKSLDILEIYREDQEDQNMSHEEKIIALEYIRENLEII